MKTLRQILEETIPEIDIMAGDWQKDRSAKDKILDEIIRKFADELPKEQEILQEKPENLDAAE